MKKFLTLMLIVMIVSMTALFAIVDAEVQSIKQTRSTKQAQVDIQAKSGMDVPIPEVRYFQERRTIAKWTERWDAPNIPTYVYLISYGNIIGYYIADGKPASTQSYLLPEERVYSSSYGNLALQSQDLDGTYGNNNPGIRFFTAEGTAVEWGGSGASYIYSDTPLPLNVPKLNAR